MYQRFWDLHRRPFDDTRDSECFYVSEGLQGAMLKLRYAIEQRCEAALLTGASGIGKTLTLTRLLKDLPERFGPVAHVTFTQMSAHELLAHLTDELTRQPSTQRTVPQMVSQLRDFLIKNVERGSHAVLVIDEAHLLREPDPWETLRLVINLSVAAGRSLTLVLMGQPSMMASLGTCPSLEERIAVKCLLRPFQPQETTEYIDHRLSKAGGRITLFSEAALAAVHAESGGAPRRINRICDLAMLVAFSEDCQQVDERHVRSVTHEIISLGGIAA